MFVWYNEALDKPGALRTFNYDCLCRPYTHRFGIVHPRYTSKEHRPVSVLLRCASFRLKHSPDSVLRRPAPSHLDKSGCAAMGSRAGPPAMMGKYVSSGIFTDSSKTLGAAAVDTDTTHSATQTLKGH